MTKVTELEEVTCCTCGTMFAMEKTLLDLRRNGGSFHCPNGHAMHFGQNNENVIKELRERVKVSETELEEKRKEVTAMRCAILKYEQTNQETTKSGFFKIFGSHD